MGNQASVTDVDLPEAMLPEAPLQLVEVDDENEFRIGEAAASALKCLGSGKICIVSVIGLYRTGKSSLVNLLLEREAGFKVGATVSRCTRGIWMWGRPRKATLANGETCWIILLDTEGLGGLEADKEYDVRIFSLATLLCSTMVYNSLGTIDENAIASLSFIAQLTRHIRINPIAGGVGVGGEGVENGGEGNGEDGSSDHHDDSELEAMQFHNHFPAFTWVLRDFSLDLVDEHGNPITPDEYLDAALKPQMGFDPQTAERNRIRQMLVAFFTHRKCFPLVRPLTDEEQLQEIDKVPFTSLRPEFQSGMEELKEHLYLHQIKPKVVNNVPLNGTSFLALCEQYIEAMSSGGVPTISSAWEEVMQRECSEARDAALEAYRSQIDQGVAAAPKGSLSALAIAEHHSQAVKIAMRLFHERAHGPDVAPNQEELEAQLMALFRDLSGRNYRESLANAKEALGALHHEHIRRKLIDGADGYLEAPEGSLLALQNDVSHVLAEIQPRVVALGPACREALATYLQDDVLDAYRWLFDRVDETKESKLNQMRESMSEIEGKLAAVEAKERYYSESIDKQQADMLALQTDKLRLESLQQANEGRMTQLLSELQTRSGQVNELRLELEETKEAYESEHHWQSTLSEKLERSQRACEDKDARNKVLEQEKASLEQSLRAQEAQALVLSGKAKDLQDEIDEKSRELNKKAADLSLATEKLSGLSQMKESLEQQVERLKAGAQEQQAQFEKSLKEFEENETRLKETVEDLKREVASTREVNKEELRAVEAKVRDAVEEKVALERQIKEFQRHSQQQEKQLADLRVQSQKKMAQLQSMMEKHRSDHAQAKNQLQQKSSREMNLEAKLEQERQVRETTVADKDSKIRGLQREIAEKGAKLQGSDKRARVLQDTIEAQMKEIVTLKAANSVLTTEKNAQQQMWQAAMNEHFSTLNSTKESHGTLQRDHDEFRAQARATEEQLRKELADYKALVMQTQTRKSGLLRKQTRSRALFGSKWQVKHVSLVGGAIVSKDPGRAGSGSGSGSGGGSGSPVSVVSSSEGKHHTFCLTPETTVQQVDFRPNAFVVRREDGTELVLGAIDREDMQGWVAVIGDVVGHLASDHSETQKLLMRLQQEEADAEEGDGELEQSIGPRSGSTGSGNKGTVRKSGKDGKDGKGVAVTATPDEEGADHKQGGDDDTDASVPPEPPTSTNL